jgi:hypothetical protein
MTKCRLCNLSNVEHDGQICSACASELGIVEMPPPRRNALPCTRCSATRFVRVIPREYATNRSGARIASPMTATAEYNAKISWLREGSEISADVRRGRGLLEMYICSACGFVEWYCHDPESIPIGPEFMTDVVDYASDAAPNR